MIGADGTPKILDFGLARILDGDLSSSGLAQAARKAEDTSSDAPTRMDERESAGVPREGVPSLTRGGQLVGTPQYMSPEQAEGEPTDARTDLFSLGVVMYQALTGRRPFEGKTLESIIGRIIEAEPAPVTSLKPVTPYTLGLLVRRCLRKKRDDRIQSARELLADLREIRKEVDSGLVLVDQSAVSAPAPSRRAGKWGLWSLAGGALVLAGVAGLFARLSAPAPERAVRRFVLPVERLPVDVGAYASFQAVSPDGSKVAYIDEDSLWIRDLDQVEPRQIADTVSAYSPFWSPDSKTVGYAKGENATVGYRGNIALWKVPVDGGAHIKICDLSGVLRKASWGGVGKIAFDTFSDRPRLFEVPDRGGTPQLVFEGERGLFNGFADGFYAPGSEELLVAYSDETLRGHLAVYEGQSSRSIEVAPDAIGRFPSYSSSGHILFDRQGADGQPGEIWAVPFSLSRMEVAGPSFLVAQNATRATVSSDGTLVYQAADSEPIEAQQLVWVDRGGTVLGTIGQPQLRIRNPVLSPDQRRVAVRGSEKDMGDADIWIHETGRPVKTRLTSQAGFDEEPSWSPDGKQVVWASQEILTMAVDTPGTPRRLVEHGSYPSFSPDGRFLVYHAGSTQSSSASRDIWYLPLEPNGEPVPYLQTQFEEGVPVLSPDGRYLAYMSDESGRFEIYVQRFPERGEKTQVSLEGGFYPRWSGAGDELFFVTGNTLMAVAVDTRDGLRVGAPVALFDGDKLDATLNTGVNLRTTYDVSRDGQRFVVVQDIKGEVPAPIVVVENWYEAFRNRD